MNRSRNLKAGYALTEQSGCVITPFAFIWKIAGEDPNADGFKVDAEIKLKKFPEGHAIHSVHDGCGRVPEYIKYKCYSEV